MKKILIFVFIFITNLAYSQYYEREYTYRASENDSKNDARYYALYEIKKILIEELGVYVRTETNLNKSGENVNIDNNIIIISEAITKTKILNEKWDGENYYIKVNMYVNKKDLLRRLDKISNYNTQSNKLNNNNITNNYSPPINKDTEILYGSFFIDHQPHNDFILTGLTFGIITNNIYDIGVYGMISINYITTDRELMFNDKGFILGLNLIKKGIYLSLPVKIGSGNIVSYQGKRDNFLTINPNVEIGLGIKNVYITSGFGYRFTDGINILDKPSDFLNGFNYYISLKLFKN